MPNCCVRKCKNSSAKGYTLKCFPRDIERRKEWIKNLNRPNFSPNRSHRICEAHFSPNMWEKTRVDGSRKLKFNAVPTVFDHIKEEPTDETTVPIVKDEKIVSENMETETSCNSENQLDKITLPIKSKFVKIVPRTNSTTHKTPILIPVTAVLNTHLLNSVNKLVVGNQGKIIQSAAVEPKKTDILEPQTKTTTVKSSPMIISSNANILRNQIKASSSQTPIIIPATTGILKSNIQTSGSSHTPMTNIYSQLKVANTKPLLIPVTIGPKSCEVKQSTINPAERPAVLANMMSTVSKSNTANLNKNVNSSLQMISKCGENTTSNVLNESQIKKMNDERFEKMDNLLLKQLKLNHALRKRLRSMNNQIQQLVREQNKNWKDFLKDVFTEDQIRVLELRHTNPKSITAWSPKTLMKAINLKKVCGTQGYEELLKQNMPLPSIRTINRWCNLRNIPIP